MIAATRSFISYALLLALASGIPSTSRALDQIVLTTMLSKEDAPLGKLTYLIYREAFRRLGYEMVFVYMPPLRGEVDAVHGNVDGELGRGKDYGDHHPNLIRVAEPAMWSTLSAYSTDANMKVKNWAGLAHNYRVEYWMGMQIPRANLLGIVAPDKLSVTGSTRQGLRKLAAGRTDIYIDFEEHVDTLLRQEPFARSEKIQKAGTMERVAIHAYLHRRHAALEPRLSAVLRDMKKQGLLKSYAEQSHLSSPGSNN